MRLSNQPAATGQSVPSSGSSLPCNDQLVAWRKADFHRYLHGFTHAQRAVGNADASAQMTNFSEKSLDQMDSAIKRLSSAIDALSLHMPPSCVPGLDARLAKVVSYAREVVADQGRLLADGRAHDLAAWNKDGQTEVSTLGKEGTYLFKADDQIMNA